MRSVVYRIHTWLGMIVAIPVLAWASSGLLYAWPNTIEGGSVANIEAAKVVITPGEAMARANRFARQTTTNHRAYPPDARRQTGVPGDWRYGCRLAFN